MKKVIKVLTGILFVAIIGFLALAAITFCGYALFNWYGNDYFQPPEKIYETIFFFYCYLTLSIMCAIPCACLICYILRHRCLHKSPCRALKVVRENGLKISLLLIVFCFLFLKDNIILNDIITLTDEKCEVPALITENILSGWFFLGMGVSGECAVISVISWIVERIRRKRIERTAKKSQMN